MHAEGKQQFAAFVGRGVNDRLTGIFYYVTKCHKKRTERVFFTSNIVYNELLGKLRIFFWLWEVYKPSHFTKTTQTPLNTTFPKKYTEA